MLLILYYVVHIFSINYIKKGGVNMKKLTKILIVVAGVVVVVVVGYLIYMYGLMDPSKM